MAKQGTTDTDMGLKDIFKEMEKLKSMCVKVGIPEETGSKKGKGEEGVTVAQYASWNELGVMNKDESGWFIPPRPFVRGWADAKREQIAKTMEKLGGLVTSGKLDADTAIRLLGQFGRSGIKSYVKNGSFTPNSDITINGSKPDKTGKKFIKGKGSNKPLVDSKRMVNAIEYQIIRKPVSMVSKK